MKHTLNAANLRLIAIISMLIDHAGCLLCPEAIWMRCIGRMAFPIFAFQIAEGYRHTRDVRRYCLRLLGFALLSEIPFDLMLSGEMISLNHQNVMLTLLLGLLAILCWERRKFLALAGILLAAELLSVDYGMPGVVTVLAFHALRGQPLALLGTMAAIHGICFGGIQLFAVFALIPIALYNGEKGRSSPLLQPFSYLFYPLHMLILWLIM